MKNQSTHKERMNEMFKKMDDSVKAVTVNGKTYIQFSESMKSALEKAFAETKKPGYKPNFFSL